MSFIPLLFSNRKDIAHLSMNPYIFDSYVWLQAFEDALHGVYGEFQMTLPKVKFQYALE